MPRIWRTASVTCCVPLDPAMNCPQESWPPSVLIGKLPLKVVSVLSKKGADLAFGADAGVLERRCVQDRVAVVELGELAVLRAVTSHAIGGRRGERRCGLADVGREPTVVEALRHRRAEDVHRRPAELPRRVPRSS
jgi:hypothetical protein